ncbi:hypothetical protein C8Q76DRAFT_769000 [Earliella scabrosa]|nr:hypothetical protein C8Q76DRAFT_769000 [Earliella scabrosa]
MAIQSHTLDQLLGHSTAGSQLAIGVKHAELAVKDLAIVVAGSNLTSKDVLAQTLQEFAQDAKVVGRDLQQLSAKLYGAVDTVLSFDEYALRSISVAQARGDDQAKLTASNMFTGTMAVLASEVTRVMLDATTVASKLDALEEKLVIIRAICQQEMTLAEGALGDVLSELWSALGGNKTKLQRLAQQVDILRNVDWYRSISVAHIVATTESLLVIEAELSELRDKLSAPELTGDAIPIEVHIASIERGARRIQEEKLKVKMDPSRYTDVGARRPPVLELPQGA